jgi:hypothetical protein
VTYFTCLPDLCQKFILERSHSVRTRGIGEAAVEGWINSNKGLFHNGKVDSTGDELLEPAELGVGGTEAEEL